MKLVPILDRVLVKLQPRPTETASGIALVHDGPDLPQVGEVIAVGPKVKDVKKGDTVHFFEAWGYDVDLNGERHRVLEQKHLLAVS